MDAGTISVVVAAALLASVARGLTGFAFSLIVMPFYLLVMHVEDAVVVSSLLGAAGVAILAVRVWREVPWPTVSRLLLGSLVGMPLGLAVLLLAPPDALRIGVGVSAIAMAGALVAGLRVPFGGARGELVTGVVAGVLKTSTSMSGPPVVLYLQGRGSPPEQFRAALVMFFLLGYLVSVGTFFGAGLVTRHAVGLAATALPAVYIGIWSGDRLLRFVDPLPFRRLVLALLVATALSGIGSALYQVLS